MVHHRSWRRCRSPRSRRKRRMWRGPYLKLLTREVCQHQKWINALRGSSNSQRWPRSRNVLEVLQTFRSRSDVIEVSRKGKEFETGKLAKLISAMVDMCNSRDSYRGIRDLAAGISRYGRRNVESQARSQSDLAQEPGGTKKMRH